MYKKTKLRFILTSSQGEYVIIMLKRKSAVIKRVSELPQSKKFGKSGYYTEFAWVKLL